MKNLDIRKSIEDAGLKHWQVAEAYGIHEGNFSRLLRRELSLEEKVKVYKAIEEAEKEYVA